MIDKLLKLIKSETGLYLFFGVMTTAVNYISFILFLNILGYDNILIVNTFSFVFAASFAYITNKLFVFKSKSWKIKLVISEALSFFSARILSYFFEQIGLYLCADVWHLERFAVFGVNGVLISKVILSFLVVILNWAISKFFIFKKK